MIGSTIARIIGVVAQVGREIMRGNIRDSIFVMVALSLLLGILAACTPVQLSTAVSRPTLSEQVFYYHNGEKVELAVNPDKSYVLFEPQASEVDVVMESLAAGEIPIPQLNVLDPIGGINLEQDVPLQLWAIVDNTTVASTVQEPDSPLAESVKYVAPFYFTQDEQEVGISHLFYVKLRSEEDFSRLQELAEVHGVEILGNNRFMPLWYTLASSKESSGNALEVANQFFESG